MLQMHITSSNTIVLDKDWIEAYEWNQENKRVISLKIEERTYAFTYAGDESGRPVLIKELCHEFFQNQSYESFDKLIKARNSIHSIEVNKEDWICYLSLKYKILDL